MKVSTKMKANRQSLALFNCMLKHLLTFESHFLNRNGPVLSGKLDNRNRGQRVSRKNYKSVTIDKLAVAE